VSHAQQGPLGAPTKKQRQNQHLHAKFWECKDAIKDSHPHIVEWFDSAPKDVKNDIISHCFSKDKAKWKMDLDKPFFKESKTRCVCVSTMGASGTLGL